MTARSSFAFGDAPTIEERVALGRKQNSTENGGIVPFPSGWSHEHLLAYFRFGSAKPLQALLKDGYELGQHYAYTSPDGAVIGLAQRLDHPTRKKKVMPLRASKVDSERPILEVRAIDEPRPLYNLPSLMTAAPEIWAMIVEGEKAAEAAKRIFPDHVVTTWSGGCKAVANADLRPLAGRRVVIWPDHDKSGWDAAATAGELLNSLGVKELRIVQTPGDFPQEWDLADPLPELSGE